MGVFIVMNKEEILKLRKNQLREINSRNIINEHFKDAKNVVDKAIKEWETAVRKFCKKQDTIMTKREKLILNRNYIELDKRLTKRSLRYIYDEFGLYPYNEKVYYNFNGKLAIKNFLNTKLFFNKSDKDEAINKNNEHKRLVKNKIIGVDVNNNKTSTKRVVICGSKNNTCCILPPYYMIRMVKKLHPTFEMVDYMNVDEECRFTDLSQSNFEEKYNKEYYILDKNNIDYQDEHNIYIDKEIELDYFQEEINREDEELIKIAEEVNNDDYLKIVEIPQDVEYEVKYRNGKEYIEEKHREWF